MSKLLSWYYDRPPNQFHRIDLKIFGELKTTDLKEGGGDIPVTNENRFGVHSKEVISNFQPNNNQVLIQFLKNLRIVWSKLAAKNNLNIYMI